MHLEVDRRRREQNTGHAAHAKVEHKSKKPQHGRVEVDPAAKFGEEPVEDFDACRNGDQHRHDAKKGVDIGTCAHREEMVQPDDEGEKGDHDKRPDHRG